MRYVSIDLETTGLDPTTCQVIQVAAILEDTDWPTRPLKNMPLCNILIRNRPVQGEPYALRMNKELIARAETQGASPLDAWYAFESQLRLWGFDSSKPALAAGKNFGSFDRQFMPPYIQNLFKHRYVDPGSVFMDWEAGPPSLRDLIGQEPAHDALQDAWDVIRVLRRAYAPCTAETSL